MTNKFMEAFDGPSTLSQLVNGITTLTGEDGTQLWAGELPFSNLTLDAGGRTGACLKKTTGNGALIVSKKLNLGTTAVCGFAFKADNPIGDAGTYPFFAFRDQQADGGAACMTVSRKADGSIVVSSGGGAGFTTAAGVIPNVWDDNIFEAKLILHDTTGFVEVRHAGIVIGSATGDTKGASNTSIERISCGGTTGAPGTDGEYWDDIYVDDTDYDPGQGTFRAQVIRADGAGAHTDWVPDSGANYARVNEQNVSDASYVQGLNDGDEDTYTYAATTHFTAHKVRAVQVNNRAAYLTAAKHIGDIVRLAGVEEQGADLVLTNALKNFATVFPVKPDSSAWGDFADVDACEFGRKQTA